MNTTHDKEIGEQKCESVYQNKGYMLFERMEDSNPLAHIWDSKFFHPKKGFKTVEAKCQTEMMAYGKVSLEWFDSNISSTYYKQNNYPEYTFKGVKGYLTGWAISKAADFFITDGLTWISGKSKMVKDYIKYNINDTKQYAHTSTAWGITITIDDLIQLSTDYYISDTTPMEQYLNQNKNNLTKMVKSL